jgi:hypothetical protein
MPENPQRICKKCGKIVEPSNDAFILILLMTSKNLSEMPDKSQHLLPIKDAKGNTVCEGMPKRAQYLEGQHRNIYGRYLSFLEAPTRDAYRQLNEIFG